MASSSDCAAQLLEVTPLVMRRIRGEMRRRTMPGLSIAQFRALNYLSRHPGASLSELAEFLGLTPPSASKLVQKLVMQRVIARRVGRDRRRVRLSVTRQGRTALDVARLETRQQLAASLESLSERELAIVSAGLQIIAEAFSASDADVSVR
ncbi:MAG: MarR family transcriptional regulator [Chloroflexi bacterium]|nr:MarR family transcriptional regulator [Chloroflexota bacterium]